VWQNTKQQKWYIISLTLHYTNYLFYCVTKYKIYKYWTPFLSLFIIQIIYSIVWQNTKQQKWYIISLTFHYTNYLFYCVTNTKTYNTISLTLHYTNYLFYCERNTKTYNTISLTLHYRYYLFYCERKQNIQNYNIPFLSLFIIDIIYSIVRENKNIQILYYIVTNTRREMGVISFLWWYAETYEKRPTNLPRIVIHWK
jgi:hypothetical protein